MENRNLEKALEIVSTLFMGEEVSIKGSHVMLYEEYSHNAEVYDITNMIFKKMDINVYEYNNTLFISGGHSNRIFGYTNEDLKKALGLRLNKELFLAYLIIFVVITEFYKDSSSSTYIEYVKPEDVIKSMDGKILSLIDKSMGIVMEEAERDSFKALALLWDELPTVSVDDKNESRAARNSKSGFVKLTFNFLCQQKLFSESEGKYFPTDRFRAIAQNYFEDNRGRLYEIMHGEGEEQNAEN